MNWEMVGIAEAKNGLSALINRVAFGGERIILGSRGKAKAAIVSLADLHKLEVFERTAEPGEVDQYALLAQASAFQERILARRGGRPLPDSAEELRKIRMERVR